MAAENQKRYKVIAKDFGSNLARNELVAGFGCLWKSDHELPMLRFGICSIKDAIKYFVHIDDMHLCQKTLYDRMMENPSSLEDLVWRSEEYATEMHRFTASIHSEDLSHWSIVRLKKAYDTFSNLQTRQDILVSVATNPNIVPVMRKAVAILTDEGGLTCHAAIVSRELGIPCIVGLKVITAVVKDGDIVEVDATNGVVTIIM